METFSLLLAISVGNSPLTGEFPAQRLVTRSFDVFFDLRPNKRLSKQSLGWWLRRHRTHYDVTVILSNTRHSCGNTNNNMAEKNYATLYYYLSQSGTNHFIRKRETIGVASFGARAILALYINLFNQPTNRNRRQNHFPHLVRWVLNSQANATNIWSIVPCIISGLFWKCCQNLCIRFPVIFAADTHSIQTTKRNNMESNLQHRHLLNDCYLNPILNVSSRPVHTFLRKVANRQKNQKRWIHNLAVCWGGDVHFSVASVDPFTAVQFPAPWKGLKLTPI